MGVFWIHVVAVGQEGTGAGCGLERGAGENAIESRACAFRRAIAPHPPRRPAPCRGLPHDTPCCSFARQSEALTCRGQKSISAGAQTLIRTDSYADMEQIETVVERHVCEHEPGDGRCERESASYSLA
jgi:hypothetical protein